jgi:hypothetical protein
MIQFNKNKVFSCRRKRMKLEQAAREETKDELNKKRLKREDNKSSI